MDLKQIEKLMAAMGRHGVRSLALRQDDFEIELEKEGEPGYAAQPMAQPMAAPAAAAPMPSAAPAAPAEQGGKAITSPMVGTFYSAPSPDDPPFVKVGDNVSADTVVCIVEAMKVMNEVKAGVSGTITEVLHKNGDPVEFGTKLFRIT